MNDADIKKGFWAEVRTTFFRGVVVIIPLGLTYWFFSSLLNAIDGIFSPILEDWLGRSIPGLGFIDDLAVLGWVMRKWSDELAAFRDWRDAQPPSHKTALETLPSVQETEQR